MIYTQSTAKEHGAIVRLVLSINNACVEYERRITSMQESWQDKDFDAIKSIADNLIQRTDYALQMADKIERIITQKKELLREYNLISLQ